MGKSIKSVVKLVTAPIKAMYDPVGAFKDVFGGVQGVFAGLTGAAKISGAPSSEPSSQTVRSSKAPVRFILGRASTGGVLAWVQEQSGDQTSGEWIHIVYVLSEGAIAGVDEIYVDERPLSELGANATSEVIIDPAQVNAFLLANCPDWRQEQIGRGLSFVRLSFKYDAEKFPSGIPDVRFVVRGRSDIYDPRNGNSGYSANTALLILWYLRNRCAIPDDEIIFQSFASAANVCDETVIGPDGKMSPRYFAGAVIGADEKRNTVLDNLLSACAGTLIRVGGRWSLQVGAYYGPADFTINEDMVIGTVEGATEVSNSDAINTMRGTFVDPAQAWAETDYPEVAIQDWIATDGGELAESQSFAYVTDAYLAQRLANISLRRRRSGGSLSVPLNFNGYNCRPGRAVKVDLPSLNILGEFMVIEWTMGAADACKVTLKPYEQAIFDDAVGQPYDPLGFINLPVGGLAAVTGLAWTPSGVAEVVQGVLSWTPPVQTVLSYTVTIRKGTEVVQSLKVGGEASSCNINGLSSGTYAMSVVAFGPGTRSGEATLNVNVGGPPVPESCAVYASVDTITLVPANLQNSLNGGTYEYFYATNPSAPIADAVYLGQGLTFTHTGLAFAKEYSYYVRSANAYGKSDFLYVLAATSSDPTQMLEVIAGQITESELGQELTKRIDLIDMNGPGSVNERLGEVRSELDQQIADTNNAVAEVNSALTAAKDSLSEALAEAQDDLQEQIDQIADLADSMPYKPGQAYTAGQGVLGEDGKLYQAKGNVPPGNPPPNATYWTDVGQAVQTANGLAARVSDVETDVSTLDGRTTAQATQIGGLQSSLTTTNQNVATAQQAADAANTLAGGKGKVIIQSAAPAVADRLAQNLWIDTTGNANTPKRWSGSAWVAVTDKAATDAAAAAQSALTQVALKADAAVVSNLSTRVSEAEGELSSQASRMDGMQTSIDGKASSQALQQVSSRVTATEQKDATQDQQLTSQSQALTSLTDSVSKKAEASTVQNLSNTVSQQGQDLAAHGQSLTRIDAALPLLSGENLLANSSFEDLIADGSRPKHWAISAGAARSLVPSPLTSSTSALRLSGTVAAGGYIEVITSPADGRSRVKVTGGATYTLSVYVRGAGAPGRLRMYIQFLDAAGVVLSAPWTADGFILTESYARYTLTGVAPAAAAQANIYAGRLFNTGAAAASLWMEIDNAQLQEGTVATAYQPSVLAANEVSAEATSALSARVDKNEQGIASTSVQVTQLSGQLDTTNQNVTNAQQAAQAASDAAGAKGKVIYQSTVPAVADRLAQNLWIDTTNNANTPKRWSGSAWVAVTDKAATDAAAAAQDALSKVVTKAEAATVQALSNTVDQHGTAITANGQAVTNINASLSQVGGENLLYNPSLDVVNASTAWLPDGWALGNAGSTLSASFVPSTLDPTGKALRLGLTIPNASSYVDLVQDTPKWPGVSEGQVLTISGHFRATNGLIAQLFFQWRDSSGAGISTDGATSQNASVAPEAWQRFSRTSAPAPAGTASVRIIYRIRGPLSGTSTTGWCEWDRLQLELGSTMTGWRDNGRVNEAGVAVNAAATTALAGRVTATEAGLTSASSQLTQLDNAIGDVGGENLFYNPAFAKYASLNGAADGWSLEGSVTTVDTLVDSWLNSGEKAQRIVGSGFTASTGSGYKSLRPQGADPDRRPAVAPGQTVTASVHIRGTAGLSLRIFLQWINAEGTVLSAPNSSLLAITAVGDRKQFSGTAPAGAAKLYVYYRVYSSTGAVTSGNVELARPQFEYGARMTGWRDNGQVNATNNAATSAAVESLSSSVNQQGNTLNSVSGRTTTLENGLTTTNQNVATAQQAAQTAAAAAGAKGEVIYGSTAPVADKRLAQNLWIDTTGNANTPKRWNGSGWVAVSDKVATDAAAAAANALSQVATKAEASAVNSLGSRVTNAEGVLTSQSSDITQLKNSVGTGAPFVAGVSWEFNGNTRGWVANTTGASFTAGPLFATVAKYTTLQATSNFPRIAGAENPYLRIRLRRRNTSRSSAAMYWANEDGGLAEVRRFNWSISTATEDWQDIEFDLSGHTGWNGKSIYAIRLDMFNSTDTNGEIDIAYIAVGRRAAAASAQAVSSMGNTVSQQGELLTAESQRIDGLYTSVGNANAAIQNEAAARANADSALSQQIQTTQSSLGDTNASVQQISTAQTGLNNRVNAQYSIKVAVTQSGVYALGGIGVGIQNQNGVLQSVVAVLADRFVVINAAGDGFVSPFAVQGDQVFMNDAFIRDASITNAKIANAAITAAKIGEAEVDTLRIRGNAVTVPVAYFTSEATAGAGVGNWIDLVAVYITLDQPGMIQMQFSCSQEYSSAGANPRSVFELYVEGTLVSASGGAATSVSPALVGALAVGAGTFKVKARWWAESDRIVVTNKSIFAMGCKR